MKKITKTQHYLIPCVIALSSISTTLSAAPNLSSLADHWYVGGSLGQSNMDPDGGNTWRTTSDTDLAKKIYVGTDISRQFGLEAFWADFGNAELVSKTNKSGKVNYKAVGANIVYNSPYKIAGLRPLGKLGVAKFNNKDKGDVTSKQNNMLTIFGGVGAEYDLSPNLTLRSEFEYYDKDINQISVGVNWSPRYRDHSFLARQQQVPVEPKIIEKIVEVPVEKVVRVPVEKVVKVPVFVSKPAPKPKPPQYKVVHKTLSGGSHFASGSANLTFDGRDALNRFAQDIRHRNISVSSIIVVGHTDNVGSHQANQILSYNRANTVAAYLASRGIERQKIRTQGMGETRPIASNDTAQGRAQNRRVEITIKGFSKEIVRR